MLLSNGHYHVLLTSRRSRVQHLPRPGVTRWREDADARLGRHVRLSSATIGERPRPGRPAYQPTARPAGRVPASSSRPRRRAIRRRDGDVETLTEVAVSPETTRRGPPRHADEPRRRDAALELTSYAEVALAPQAADLAHPAFGNLFVETELVADRGAALHAPAAQRPSEPDAGWST